MSCTRDPLPSEEVTANLESLAEMPPDLLPEDSPARLALVWLISSGLDVYAYWSGGRTYGTPVVWLQPLADVRSGKDGRVAIREWCEQWEALLAEMGLLPAAETATATETATNAKEATA